MLELLFLLLPVAAGYGWFMGRNSMKQKRHNATQDLSIKYSTGLNYLLSNQQDKAIDYLLEALKVEDDTVEAHFAMANLFRRRGELDRALKIHEHLVRHAHLPTKEKQQAIFELGKDFFSAGLYDRAEKMFIKLVKTKRYQTRALSFLMQIYQSTKDWQHGIELHKTIVKSGEKKLSHSLANFYCEQAQLALDKEQYHQVVTALHQALGCDENCSRANWMLAQLHEQQHDYQQAIICYKAVYQQDADFFPDVIEAMHQCYVELNNEQEFYHFMQQVYDKTGSTSALLKYVDHLQHHASEQKAHDYLLLALKRRPTIRGFKYFIKMQIEQATTIEQQQNLEVIKQMIGEYLAIKPRYSCRQCGFNSAKHYWACPSCHDWEQLKPVRGLEGE